jgi:predicted transposase YdaD
LVDFLHYIEDSTDQRAAETKSERIKRIHDRVRKVKLSEEVGVKYMQAWEEKYYEREEGREEGRNQERRAGQLKQISLFQKKIKKGKNIEEVADALEEEVADISELYDIVKENLEKDPEDILELWLGKQK